jgi:fumarate hydratase class II
VAAQVIGNDATVAWAGAAGNFELNVMMPVMARNLLESIRLLASACVVFATRAVEGIEADADRCRHYAESSPALATALNPHIGYEAAAEVVKEAMTSDRTVKEVVVEKGLMSEGDAARALDVAAMTRGGLL